MNGLHRFRLRPVYLLVVERVLSHATLNELDEIPANLDKLIEQRDDIISQIYRTMFFLATLLILVFLIEINLVAIPSTVWGVKLTFDGARTSEVVNNNDLFIFGFLLIGNIVALLFSSAMFKMFTLEYMIGTYSWLRYEGASRYFSNVAYRFYVFIFDSIADQTSSLPRAITAVSRVIHWMTVFVLPVTFIGFYCLVLGRALIRFWDEEPSGVDFFGASVEFWYSAILAFFNLVTLSLYAFVFFPCVTRVIGTEQLEKEIEVRANELWEEAGRPEGKLKDIERLANRQIRLRHHMI